MLFLSAQLYVHLIGRVKKDTYASTASSLAMATKGGLAQYVPRMRLSSSREVDLISQMNRPVSESQT
jgi:hypothetical protein